MKKRLLKTPLTLAVSLAFISTSAFADQATIDKSISITKSLDYSGFVDVFGFIDVDSLSMAVVNNRQSVTDNILTSDALDNSAKLQNDALKGVSGNIGVNVAAGDSNAQDNAAALAAADTAFLLGSGDAEVFVDQQSSANLTTNNGTLNTALLGSGALQNAQGNIGVNVVAGSQNLQKNSLAASVSSGSMSEATVSSNQVIELQDTLNAVVDENLLGVIVSSPGLPPAVFFNSNNATLGGGALEGASGNIGVNVAAGTNNLQSNSLSISMINQ